MMFSRRCKSVKKIFFFSSARLALLESRVPDYYMQDATAAMPEKLYWSTFSEIKLHDGRSSEYQFIGPL